jgi:hypothetical protein
MDGVDRLLIDHRTCTAHDIACVNRKHVLAELLIQLGG